MPSVKPKVISHPSAADHDTQNETKTPETLKNTVADNHPLKRENPKDEKGQEPEGEQKRKAV